MKLALVGESTFAEEEWEEAEESKGKVMMMG